jgi:hypothetical protein
VLDEDQLAGASAVGGEVHGNEFAVERQVRQGHALHALGLGYGDCRRVFDDVFGVARRLLRIPELDAADLGGRFDGDQRLGSILDAEDAADRLCLLRVLRPARGRAVNADQRDVRPQNQATVEWIRLLSRLHEDCPAGLRGGGDRLLEIRRVHGGRILRQHPARTNPDHPRRRLSVDAGR